MVDTDRCASADLSVHDQRAHTHCRHTRRADASMPADSSYSADTPLSDEEMDRRLARYSASPSDLQRSGGLERGSAYGMLVCALIGMWASLSLIMAEKVKLSDPQAALACDVNSVVGCGKWIGAWQNEVFFGISNAVIGLSFFSGIAALALVLAAGGILPRIIWQLLCVGVSLGMVWVVWFQYESFFVARSLCPYCFVTWIVVIALLIHVWSRSLQAGHWGAGAEKIGRFLVLNRYVALCICYVILFLAILFAFWNKWMQVLGL